MIKKKINVIYKQLPNALAYFIFYQTHVGPDLAIFKSRVTNPI